MTVYFWRVEWDETEPLSRYGRTLEDDDPRIVDPDPDPSCDHEWVNVQADIPERFEATEPLDREEASDDASEWITEIVFEIRFKCLQCGADRLRALPYPS